MTDAMAMGAHAPSSSDTAAEQRLESALVRGVANGDQESLAELYDRYRVRAYSVALRVTTNRTLAEDVVQDAFVALWRNAGRYAEERGSVRTWLLAIVHHRAIDSVRRRRSTLQVPDVDARAPAILVTVDVWPEVAGRLDHDEIVAAIGTLPSVQRVAIALAYYGGFTQQQIAAHTGAPLGTVKSRVRLGLLAMRATLTRDERAERTDDTRSDRAVDRAMSRAPRAEPTQGQHEAAALAQ